MYFATATQRAPYARVRALNINGFTAGPAGQHIEVTGQQANGQLLQLLRLTLLERWERDGWSGGCGGTVYN